MSTSDKHQPESGDRRMIHRDAPTRRTEKIEKESTSQKEKESSKLPNIGKPKFKKGEPSHRRWEKQLDRETSTNDRGN